MKILLILFILTCTVKSLTQTKSYSDNEFIIAFKQGVLNSEFLNSQNRLFEISEIFNEVSDDTKYFEDVTLLKSTIGGKTKVRKLMRKKIIKDMISVSRYGDTINFEHLLDITVIILDEPNNNLPRLINSLNTLNIIKYCEPSYFYSQCITPSNDPEFFRQRGFEQLNDSDIDLERAWDFNVGKPNIKVAIVDNGIDYNNFDLGNGAFGTSGAKIRGGWDYYDNDSDPISDAPTDNHATPIAGIIGGLRNNSQGISGIAGGDGTISSGCQLFALKISDKGENWSGSLINEAIIDASLSSGYGCHILNLSFGKYSFSNSMLDAVYTAVSNNVVVVAGKGNDGVDTPFYPADMHENWVLATGASDQNDNRAIFTQFESSNFGVNIDFVAPGALQNIFTTDRVGIAGRDLGDYTTFNGTSAAAPVVAGVAALILSEAHDQNRILHHNDVEWLLKVSADDVNSNTLPGYDDQLGHGRINAGRALEMMNDPWVMTHHTATGGNIVSSSPSQGLCYRGSGPLATHCHYYGKIHEVQTTITLPDYLSDSFIWARTTNASLGWSQANVNHQTGYCEVVSRSGNQVTLKTFVHEISSYNIGYEPATPQSVVFAYTTLGIPCASNLTIDEPIYLNVDADVVDYNASNNITAEALIDQDAEVGFYAGNEIRLTDGFHITEGSYLEAQIQSCTTTTYKEGSFTVDNTPNVNTKPSNGNPITISPNPASQSIEVTFGGLVEDAEVTAYIVDIMGRRLADIYNGLQSRSTTLSQQVDISRYPAGTYSIVLQTGKHTYSEQFVKLD